MCVYLDLDIDIDVSVMTKEESKQCDMGRTYCDIAGFDDRERGPQVKKYRWPVEIGKGKEMNSPLEPQERNF